ncbi:hypothetical protein C8R45DRAFT_367494 [Mycena sanguinolenta]|nr:hypothetical protein C8R45DRAFT_367494 [Mycena sanguinolenta]
MHRFKVHLVDVGYPSLGLGLQFRSRASKDSFIGSRTPLPGIEVADSTYAQFRRVLADLFLSVSLLRRRSKKRQVVTPIFRNSCFRAENSSGSLVFRNPQARKCTVFQTPNYPTAISALLHHCDPRLIRLRPQWRPRTSAPICVCSLGLQDSGSSMGLNTLSCGKLQIRRRSQFPQLQVHFKFPAESIRISTQYQLLSFPHYSGRHTIILRACASARY